jgi:hypothetical protein
MGFIVWFQASWFGAALANGLSVKHLTQPPPGRAKKTGRLPAGPAKPVKCLTDFAVERRRGAS